MVLTSQWIAPYRDCLLFVSLRSSSLKSFQLIALNERTVNVNESIQAIGEKGGGNFIVGSAVYNLSRSKYGKRLVQSTTRDYGNARWLGKANGTLEVALSSDDFYIIFKSIRRKERPSRTVSGMPKSSFKSQVRRSRSTGRGRTSSGRMRF